MSKSIAILFLFLACATGAHAQQASPASPPAAEDTGREQADGARPDSPRAMSGMSILGNEEAPKSLVIVPWKSSRLGDDPDVRGALDERATPVDRDVFLRELSYYEIRSGG